MHETWNSHRSNSIVLEGFNRDSFQIDASGMQAGCQPFCLADIHKRQ